MSKELNANCYELATTDYRKEFENLLSKIIICYNLMLTDGIALANNENEIRDVLINNYLNDNSIRKKNRIRGYLFDKEVPESIGRTDIKIQTNNTFVDTKAYYIIECKRLDNKNLLGITGLNAEYVKNGICRFVNDYYTSYFRINGMIGFVVKDIDIDTNITHINSLLSKDLVNKKGEKVNANPIKEISRIEIIEDFKYSYKSTHKAINQKEIDLYHLMLNFSNIIQ